MSFEKMPIETTTAEKDPRELAKEALASFPEEAVVFENIPEDSEVFEQIKSLDKLALDPDALKERADRFRKIKDTLHARAGHTVEVGSGLNSEEVEDAINFLRSEADAYRSMVEALEQVGTE
jgi:hypothetical protein